MLGRRHLLSLPATPGSLARRRLLRVRGAPAESLAALDQRVVAASGGAWGLAGGPGGALWGGLATPWLGVFAGFPFGMAAAELGWWLATPAGARLWTAGHAAAGLRGFPCAMQAAPLVLRSEWPLETSADWRGLRVDCPTEGILADAVRALGARPGPAAGRHGYRVWPAHGGVVGLAVPLGQLDPGLAEVLALACAEGFAEPEPVPGVLPPLPGPAAAALAAAMAEALEALLARPEARALGVAEHYAAARRAALGFGDGA